MYAHKKRPQESKKLTLIILCGKHPLHSSGGYAQYGASVAAVASSLAVDVHIVCIGKKANVETTSFGTIHTVGVPFFGSRFTDGAEMTFLLLYSMYLVHTLRKLITLNEPSRVVVWGIGPWTLAGIFLQLFKPHAIVIADYFTTIFHESHDLQKNLVTLPYSIAITSKTFLATVLLIPLYSFLEKIIVSKSYTIVTHYNSTRSILTHQFGVPLSRFTHLPYTLFKNREKGEVKSVPSTHNVPLLLTISRHDGRKGIPDLLEAYRLLIQKGVKFQAIVAGDGMLYKHHIVLLEKLGLNEHVHLIGYIKNINSYLKRAYLFVLPSHEEGSSSLAVLEAMRAGIPVVATAIDGIGEDIESNKSGILVPPHKPQKLAQAIEYLLNNPPKAKRLGLSGKTRYEVLHNQSQARQYLRKFLRML